MTDPADLDLLQVLAELSTGRLTASAYAEALGERIESGSSLNAMISWSRESVRAAAAMSDDRRRRGYLLGPLDGVPFLVKDNIHTADLPTTAGTPALVGHHPPGDAPVVERLRRHGGIVLGKTNMHELAFGVTSNNAAFGPVHNPLDPTRVAGGSSGGTAAAIAAGFSTVGFATDTGGSARTPAAFCGIVGWRPSSGRYPLDGVVPISRTRDTVGLMTRSAADLAVVDALLTGTSPTAIPKLDGVRLAVPHHFFFEDLSADVQLRIDWALAALRRAGCILVDLPLTGVERIEEDVGSPIELFELTGMLTAYLAETAGPSFERLVSLAASPDVRRTFAAVKAQPISQASYDEARLQARPRMQRLYANYLRANDVAAILMPSVPTTAPRIGEDDEMMHNGRVVSPFTIIGRNANLASIIGSPSLSLPIGYGPTGLAVGLQIEAAIGDDTRLLALGTAIEECLRRAMTG